MALIVPAIIGFLLAAITEDGALLINIAVFGATVSYVLMSFSHILLRRREPELERPYRTPGGVATSGVAFVLAVQALRLLAMVLAAPLLVRIAGGRRAPTAAPGG